LVGQAALDDVGAVVGAGLDGGDAAAVGAVDQLHQGLRALRTQVHLGRLRRTASVTHRQEKKGRVQMAGV